MVKGGRGGFVSDIFIFIDGGIEALFVWPHAIEATSSSGSN